MSEEPSDELALPEDQLKYAYLLKVAGKRPDEIAEELGYPSGAALNKAILVAMNREALMTPPDERATLVQLQGDRLNFMLSRLWPAIEHGDPKSIDAGLRVLAMINKLHQLDTVDTAHQTMQVLVVGGAEADYIEKLKGLTHGT